MWVAKANRFGGYPQGESFLLKGMSLVVLIAEGLGWKAIQKDELRENDDAYFMRKWTEAS